MITLESNIYEELYDACFVGDVLKLKVIIPQIPDIDKSNDRGWNAIIIGAFNQHCEIVHHLIEFGANVNSINKNGTTVLMYAKTNLMENSDFVILDLLLGYGADINKRDFKNNWTILDYVKLTNNKNLIDYLKSKGAI